MPHNNQDIVVQQLNNILANTYSLYFKTHSYHWNVEGMHFHTLHTMFEEHYTEMWAAIDEIAERIRALGAYAPLNHAKIIKASQIEQDDTVPTAKDMITNLVTGHETLISSLNQALTIAQQNNDEVTSDVCLARLQIHEKTLWMLNSLNK
ncbi:MAG: DNA starvation/stationary phase protection protein [Hyphomicrobiales bacterium]|nr:MAG: DNA starvation/stationary phase protection protein [Hyphomicrobiales bacterium]